jgi:hypothetical protein
MTTITCTSTVRHGDTHLTVTGTGETRQAAFAAAVEATDIGYRPSANNARGGANLLTAFDAGQHGRAQSHYAYLTPDPEGPRIQIGWCDFTFTSSPVVRLWAVTAQVETVGPDGSGVRQVPTFFLDPTVQGITDRGHAIRIAHEILDTMIGTSDPDFLPHVTVEPVY